MDSSNPKSIITNGPLKATIEVVRACNLHCPSCPVGNGLARKWPIMPFDMFRRIIDVCAQTLEQLSLFNYGEPLLCSGINKYITYAKKAGIKRVIIHTNGTLLSRSMSRRLLNARLDRLTISIDGVNADTYSKYRKGGDFNLVLDNIKSFIRMRDKLGEVVPHVEGQFIVMSHNEYQMVQFNKMCQSLGVDTVSFKTYNPRMDLTECPSRAKLAPQNPALTRSLRKQDDDIKHTLKNCLWPRKVLTVNADSTVVPCCYDYNNWFAIGSFKDQNHAKWWHSKERYSFIRKLENDPLSIRLCRCCPNKSISLWKSHLKQSLSQ